MDKYIGKKYGKMTVLEYVRSGKHHAKYYKCRCDCGVIKEVNVYTLTRGTTKSCGCHRRLTARRTDNKYKTHGGSASKLYSVWHGMKVRCYNKNAKDYPTYGGKGITVCDEWRNSFENFQKWALSNGFSPELTIERKDIQKGYSPENCIWVDRRQQARNRSSSHWVDIRGERKLFSEWCKEFNISRSTVYNRIKRGMSMEEALTMPIKGENN